jgi:ubiquinone/menaquinone biosynthesis C-methylase UbiE
MIISTKNSQQKIWNESTKTIPLDRDPSVYAIDREKLFPRQSIVCDLGGGVGAESIYFLQKGHSVIITDISDVGLDRAKKKATEFGLGNKLTLIQKDLSVGDLPIADNYCDVVYSRLALHYFSKMRTEELFKEIYRILKPGGTSYITIKSPKDAKGMLFLRTTAKELEDEVFDDKGQKKSRFSESTIINILRNAGIDSFEVKDYIEDFSGRIDRVKSGANKLLLTEIVITK